MKITLIVGVAIIAIGVVTTRVAKDPPTANLGVLTVGVGALVMLGGIIAAVLL